jgi:putative Mg2+ transporter-C (MgtC) family protein
MIDQFTQFISTPEVHNLLLAAVLGSLIGLERELSGKDPSLRTFMLICLGSAIYAQTSILVAEISHPADPGRIAAQVVTGVGFLGAGAIFKSEKGIEGLTTAALIWLTAAIGLACGFGYVPLGTTSALMALLFMIGLRGVHAIIRYYRALRRINKRQQRIDSGKL